MWIDAPVPVDATVIVTARKRPEALLKVPESLTVFPGQAVRDLDIRSVADFAVKTPNLSFAYGNGATAIGDARTIAIRGVSGPGTTALYIDQTPVPGSLDPHIIDADHIEVMKGPQGTLDGEGSLGGSVRIVTAPPAFDTHSLDLTVEAGLTSGGGSVDGAASVVANAAVMPGQVAVRAVAFTDHQAGYLTRSFPGGAVRDQGATSTYGGSVAVFAHLSARLDATFRILSQRQDDYGFPAAFAPLPAFEPVSRLDRPFDVQPKVSDRWVLPSLDVAWRGEGWRIESTTSGFSRDIHEVEDSTTGTAQFLASIGADLPAQPYVWTSRRRRSAASNETRLSFGDTSDVNGVAGVFYSTTADDFVIPWISGQGLAAATGWGDDLLWTMDIRSTQRNAALFAEVNVPLLKRFIVTLGARQYWLSQTYHIRADGYLDGGLTDGAPGHNDEQGLSPKVALSWQADAKTQVYASAARGFRAGGSGQAVIPQCDASLAQLGLSEAQAERYGSDAVWSYEAGAKHQAGGLLITGALYHLDWRDIQQSVFLPSCAFIITANAGAARADGGEFEVAGQVTPRLGVRFGVGYEDARLTDPGASGRTGGARVYQVPRMTASGSAMYRWQIGGDASSFAGIDAGYVGDSVSGNGGGGTELIRPAYTIVNARLGVRRGANEISLNIRNLGNARVNLGDIGYLGYQQHEIDAPDVPVPQVVTLPPLSVTLRFERRY